MINCAHPEHFEDVLGSGDPSIGRIRAVRVNASRMSHAELDESEVLDEGDPGELGRQLAALRERAPHINVLGGCCGTDHRHIDAVARACRPV
jgi:S-methylmethionine-dependent homocysteine/selenocysteine methylase